MTVFNASYVLDLENKINELESDNEAKDNRIAELEAYQAEILKSHEWEQNRAMELEAQNKNYLATIKSQLATIKSQSEDKREFWTQTQAERDQLAASLETAQRALEAIRNTYYNQQISTLHVAVTMCSFAQEALAQIAKPAKPEPGMKCGYCGERWPKPGHFDDRGFCRSSREFGLEG